MKLKARTFLRTFCSLVHTNEYEYVLTETRTSTYQQKLFAEYAQKGHFRLLFTLYDLFHFHCLQTSVHQANT